MAYDDKRTNQREENVAYLVRKKILRKSLALKGTTGKNAKVVYLGSSELFALRNQVDVRTANTDGSGRMTVMGLDIYSVNSDKHVGVG